MNFNFVTTNGTTVEVFIPLKHIDSVKFNVIEPESDTKECLLVVDDIGAKIMDFNNVDGNLNRAKAKIFN